MGFLSYQSWLLTVALTLATLLAIRTTAMVKRSRGALEHTSRRRQELKVLYDPTNADNGPCPGPSRNDQVVECVFPSQSFADMTM